VTNRQRRLALKTSKWNTPIPQCLTGQYSHWPLHPRRSGQRVEFASHANTLTAQYARGDFWPCVNSVFQSLLATDTRPLQIPAQLAQRCWHGNSEKAGVVWRSKVAQIAQLSVGGLCFASQYTDRTSRLKDTRVIDQCPFTQVHPSTTTPKGRWSTGCNLLCTRIYA
jgi:hypothetical protein